MSKVSIALEIRVKSYILASVKSSDLTKNISVH